ncbi:MAG: Stp1/IreP family PP2C-type Ser/Thr phosphatase [Coriobacteriia bacterium]|nr:Stp1/IreP family PP2C-type Ser/Thr phosphatase [Coriobacteriia bacterium]
MTPKTKPSWASLTDVGRVREHNEDSVLAQPPLFVVADGLGGHEAGEVASSIAVETLRDHAPRRPDSKALTRAVRAANREVMRAAREGYGRQGMGTTMTAAIVEGTHIALAQVGDSRAYLLHAGELSQLTDDHSMVADMIRRGQLTEAESRYHPNRSVITRALGTDPNMAADAFDYDAEPGDRLLLCSDGLTAMLEDGAIAEALGAYKDPAIAARMLVDAANDAGGHDNVSVIVVDIEGDPSRAGSSVDARGKRADSGILAIIGWLLLFVLVVGGIVYGSYLYAYKQAFLRANADGVVYVYQGVPGQLGSLKLERFVEATPVTVDSVPPADQQTLREGMRFKSLDEARAKARAYTASGL